MFLRASVILMLLAWPLHSNAQLMPDIPSEPAQAEGHVNCLDQHLATLSNTNPNIPDLHKLVREFRELNTIIHDSNSNSYNHLFNTMNISTIEEIELCPTYPLAQNFIHSEDDFQVGRRSILNLQNTIHEIVHAVFWHEMDTNDEIQQIFAQASTDYERNGYLESGKRIQCGFHVTHEAIADYVATVYIEYMHSYYILSRLNDLVQPPIDQFFLFHEFLNGVIPPGTRGLPNLPRTILEPIVRSQLNPLILQIKQLELEYNNHIGIIRDKHNFYVLRRNTGYAYPGIGCVRNLLAHQDDVLMDMPEYLHREVVLNYIPGGIENDFDSVASLRRMMIDFPKFE